MRAFEYIDAVSVEDAIGLLRKEPESRIIAGGTDLLVLMKDRLLGPRLLVNIKTIEGLNVIEMNGAGGVSIGALTTMTACAEDRLVQREFPILTQAIRVAASPQLRNQASIGGNLCQKPRCWYYRESFDCFFGGGKGCLALSGQNRDAGVFGGSECYAVNPSDLAPALVALDATIAIQDAGGLRQIPIAEFFTSPHKSLLNMNILERDEMIVGIQIATQPHDSRGVYLKSMERKTWSFAQASVAIQLSRVDGKIDDVRIVLGSVAPIPWRARASEDILRGKLPMAELIDSAANAAVEGAKPSGANGYKVALVKELVRRGLGLAIGG